MRRERFKCLIAWLVLSLVGSALIGIMVGQIQDGLVTCRIVRVSGSRGWNADNLGK